MRLVLSVQSYFTIFSYEEVCPHLYRALYLFTLSKEGRYSSTYFIVALFGISKVLFGRLSNILIS